MDGIFGADAEEPLDENSKHTQLYVDNGGTDWSLIKVCFLEELCKKKGIKETK